MDRQLCVTGSGKRAVVVYAPRTFANDPKLMARGGFSAVVDLASGGVTKLKVKASLSYYNPGCGTGKQAVLTQSPGEDRRQTRLLRVDAGTGKVAEPIVVDGQITSSVPTRDRRRDRALVDIDQRGTKKRLATTGAVPYRISADGDGGYVFLERVQRDSLGQARTALVRHRTQNASWVFMVLVYSRFAASFPPPPPFQSEAQSAGAGRTTGPGKRWSLGARGAPGQVRRRNQPRPRSGSGPPSGSGGGPSRSSSSGA